MATRKSKIAAALAAVEMLLAEEAAAFHAANAGPARDAARAPSPWSLAGRIALMGSRMGSLGRAARRTG